VISLCGSVRANNSSSFRYVIVPTGSKHGMGCIPLRHLRVGFCYRLRIRPFVGPWIDHTKPPPVRWLRGGGPCVVDFSVTQDLEVQVGTATTLEHGADLRPVLPPLNCCEDNVRVTINRLN